MSVQIKDGSYYRRRDGMVVGPAKKSNMASYPWAVGQCTYTNDGLQRVGRTYDPDLIAEVEVRETLGFELVAGQKYATEWLDGGYGPAVELKEAKWVHAGMREHLPFMFYMGDEIFYCTANGEAFADLQSGRQLRITATYTPPTLSAHLRAVWEERGNAADAKFGELLGKVAELEGRTA
jgi:hypothetical protein